LVITKIQLLDSNNQILVMNSHFPVLISIEMKPRLSLIQTLPLVFAILSGQFQAFIPCFQTRLSFYETIFS